MQGQLVREEDRVKQLLKMFEDIKEKRQVGVGLNIKEEEALIQKKAAERKAGTGSSGAAKGKGGGKPKAIVRTQEAKRTKTTTPTKVAGKTKTSTAKIASKPASSNNNAVAGSASPARPWIVENLLH